MSRGLVFIVSCDTFSTYAGEDGEEVYIAHGGGFRRLIEFDGIDLADSWQQYLAAPRDVWLSQTAKQSFWVDQLRTSVIDPDDVDQIAWCADCERPLHQDDLYSVNHGQVCESCSENYTECYSCEERYTDTTTTLSDYEVCESCRDRRFSFCDDCDGYYRDNQGCGGDHDDDDEGGIGCCSSPAFDFTVRNDGEMPLDNDERVTITLPAGVITDEGMGALATLLREQSSRSTGPLTDALWAMSYDLIEKIGPVWQTKQGNFTKRLSRYLYNTYTAKITPELLSAVGVIAREHSTAVDFALEVTRDLNLSASDFYHDDSCWWQSYSEGRCALKSNGGYALRTFGDYNRVTGRAWVMPLRQDLDDVLHPTFDTENAAGFVVFNGYGTLSGYNPARIIAHMAGMTYRKIGFECGITDASQNMYVNSGGYLVAPEEIAGRYTDGHLGLSVTQHSMLFTSEGKVLTNA